MKFSTLVCLALGWLMTAAAGEPKPITVNVGQEFKITLQYNASTGYQWQFGQPPDEKFLKLMGTEYKKADSKLVGAGGDEVWTFKALAEGKTTIELTYIRPWEKGTKPARSTNFVVVVQAKKTKTSGG
jgi:inhibitor of cysteine peptidase